MKHETERLLTVSTAHLKETTADKAEQGLLPVPCFNKGGYGWFIFVGDGENDSLIDYPDLQGLIDICRSEGCTWLCLDADGPLIDDLPKYEW